VPEHVAVSPLLSDHRISRPHCNCRSTAWSDAVADIADILPPSDPGGPFSPIPEGSENPSIDSFITHSIPVLAKCLRDTLTPEDFTEPEAEASPEAEAFRHIPDYQVPYIEGVEGINAIYSTVHNYHVVAANLRHKLPWDYHLDDEPEFTEVHYAGNSWKVLSGVPREPLPGEVVVMRVYIAKHIKKIVVQRDDDILTKEEIAAHLEEVEAAMLEELKTWAKYNCFTRRERRGARNVIDCRWVLKWKWEHEAVGADSSQGDQQKARRVIRARLTVRGFKDIEKNYIDKYAGTSQRYSQRILVSEAVRRGWDIVTADISFPSRGNLQGISCIDW
jgi:hypothetical protein